MKSRGGVRPRDRAEQAIRIRALTARNRTRAHAPRPGVLGSLRWASKAPKRPRPDRQLTHSGHSNRCAIAGSASTDEKSRAASAFLWGALERGAFWVLIWVSRGPRVGSWTTHSDGTARTGVHMVCAGLFCCAGRRFGAQGDTVDGGDVGYFGVE
jgi:hypothetical protein